LLTSEFAVIGHKKLTDESVVEEIAAKLGATPAQVLVAWGVYRGYSVIPKSVQEERIISNFKQVALSEEDYKKISALSHGRHVRCVWQVYFVCDAVLNAMQVQHPVPLHAEVGYFALRRAGGGQCDVQGQGCMSSSRV
jgi:hypothetical protein